MSPSIGSRWRNRRSPGLTYLKWKRCRKAKNRLVRVWRAAVRCPAQPGAGLNVLVHLSRRWPLDEQLSARYRVVTRSVQSQREIAIFGPDQEQPWKSSSISRNGS